MNKLHDRIFELAQDAYVQGDLRLCATLVTVHGCVVHGSLEEFFEGVKLYLGRGAATQLVDMVAESIEARKQSISKN